MPEPEKPDETQPGETPEQKALREALADAEKWKALSRKNEEQAKSNADKAKKFDEHEEATKSELEKLQARAEAAEKVNAEREAKEAAAKLRDEVAEEKKFADRKISASALRGSTREELEAHADELLALVPAPPAAPSADGQGSTGKPIGEGEMSVDDVVAAATAR
ncbi:membrane protein involved in colicin uptake [Curtobacterium flaccumfaciens]|uniref:Membrane protein involved in colicin uptake n=1 Tax=Curtobacterium salicis TaxID=1779862 RepID=A0ABX0TAN2_9MICO|nr:hypothetical protein [Curtobacterium sp. WW7]NII42117.1 membrane protein involved in colicin uptake [Curtobacterium sp. WW7]